MICSLCSKKIGGAKLTCGVCRFAIYVIIQNKNSDVFFEQGMFCRPCLRAYIRDPSNKRRFRGQVMYVSPVTKNLIVNSPRASIAFVSEHDFLTDIIESSFRSKQAITAVLLRMADKLSDKARENIFLGQRNPTAQTFKYFTMRDIAATIASLLACELNRSRAQPAPKKNDFFVPARIQCFIKKLTTFAPDQKAALLDNMARVAEDIRRRHRAV